MKIITYYLPQFHSIPENDEWWGKDFTEWVNVKSAKPQFKGHNQPRIPKDDNYYNLTNVKTLEWQAKIAKQYGIYGFCYYHYWFEGHMLLQKPAEIMLQNKSVDIPFCFSWANHTWKRTWATKEKTVLLKQTYGDSKDWEKHFNYLLPFFKDERYIKIEGKPVFVIYNAATMENGFEMLKLWETMAKKNGLSGIYFIYQANSYHQSPNSELKSLFECGIEYQPERAETEYKKSVKGVTKRLLNILADKLPVFRGKSTTLTFNYDDLWGRILKQKPLSKDAIPGAFVDWDDSPRRKNRGSVCLDFTPEKLEKYLTLQIKRAKDIYFKDIIFMFAWNEWGECGYLEPDELHGYKMLEAVKNSLIANDEFPAK